MKKAVQTCGLILTICLASIAFAQTSVTLTGVAGQSYDGIYVSPYYANVGGTTTTVICDDFADDSSVGSTWNAQKTSFSNVNSSNTSWGLAGQNTSLYGAVGYLTNLVLAAAPGSTAQIIDTFALWAVFDPSGVESYLASHPITSGSLTTAALCNDIFGTNGCTSSTAQAGSLLAIAETYTTGQFSNLVVLSPDVTGTSTLCKAESGNCPAQEFIYLSVADGGTTIAYLLIVCVCFAGAMFVHSRRRVVIPTL